MVTNALGDLLLAIHHIGSTAIPGIHAKPIIDMLVAVSDVLLLDGKVRQLEVLGYEAMGEFGIAGRRFFRKNDHDGNRTHHVHVFQAASPQIERHLAFRDFMRAHPNYANQYDALKLHLATLYPTDIASYMDGKDEFIREMDARAALWRAGGKSTK